MHRILSIIIALSILLFWACTDTTPDIKTTEKQAASCSNGETIMDPNDTKAMALMMRTMANQCDSMRLDLLAGKRVDSIRYPLMPFEHAEPSDSSNLVPLFYENASLFASAYRTLMSDTMQQTEHYTAMIQSCVHCHNSFCSGPLRRIRKLTLDYKDKVQ